ncbi:MAG: outer membrane beta-barrel protein [Ferruginibacter sp.]
MSKEEQFEYIENKIKEAAENNQPVFEEEAWAKMEALLDKEKRRRPFLWLWFLVPVLLLGGLETYLLLHNSSSQNNIYKNETAGKTYQDKNKKSELVALQKSQVPAERIMTSAVKYFNDAVNIGKPDKNKNKEQIKNNSRGTIKNEFIIYPGRTDNSEYFLPEKKSITSKENLKIKIISGSLDDIDADKISADKEKINALDEITKSTGNVARDTTVINNKSTAKQKQHKTIAGFYLLASAGAEEGGVNLFSFKNSSLSPKYGLGLGYRLNNKLSVQTGFYRSRKKYLAGPDEYHTKQGSYLNMVKISRVDANCLVYEIPLSARFDFIRKPTTVYYATTGLSSYIMKREDYKYYFTNNNIPGQSAWTYRGNKNLFSILTLSAGIEKKINKNISIQAEPSVSIPLAGVGDGSVKIFSTTLQVGLKYQFLKKK